MANPFGELLLDVANQAARAVNAAESTLRRVEQVSRDMLELSQRVAMLEADKEWTGEERRKVDGRLETGDHTFQKLQTEVEILSKELSAVMKTAGAAIRETESIKKALLRRDDRQSSRRWEIWKIVLATIIPMACGGIGTAVAYYFSKGGGP